IWRHRTRRRCRGDTPAWCPPFWDLLSWLRLPQPARRRQRAERARLDLRGAVDLPERSMKLRTAAGLLRSGQVGLLLSLPRLLPPYARVCFLGAGAAPGLLRRLAAGPAPLDRLAAELASDPAGLDALEAWLDFGVSLGALRRGPAGYALRGRLARALAD